VAEPTIQIGKATVLIIDNQTGFFGYFFLKRKREHALTLFEKTNVIMQAMLSMALKIWH